MWGLLELVLKALPVGLASCSAMEEVLIMGFQKPHPVLWGFGCFFHLIRFFSPLKIQQMFAAIRRTPNLAFPSLCRERTIFTIVFLKKTRGKHYFYLFQ